MPPKVSVIVPAYNASAFLHRCLDSVLGQTLGGDHIELIVGEDGSSDNTRAVLLDYAARHPQVVTDVHDNVGVGATRNRALELATGEFVAFLDADDWWDTDYLATFVGRAEETGADVVYGGYRRVDPQGKILKEQEVVEAPFGRFIVVSACAKLHRRAHLEAAQLTFPGGRFGEDAIFTMRELAAGGTWVPVRYTGYNYLDNPASATNADQKIFTQRNADEAARLLQALLDAGSSLAADRHYRYYILRTIAYHVLFSRRSMTPKEFLAFSHRLFSIAEAAGVRVDSLALASRPPKGESPVTAGVIAALVTARRTGTLPLLATALCRGA